MAEDRYVFVVEWFDSAASVVRTYNLTYYLKDNTIDMVRPPHISVRSQEQASVPQTMRVPRSTTEGCVPRGDSQRVRSTAESH